MHARRRPLATAWLAALLALAATAPAHAADWSGRGVFAFSTRQPCPLADAPGPCNRVALDDADTRARLDESAQVIRFTNGRSYARKTIVGDVLLQGSGVAADGQRVPLNFHIVLSKKGSDWSVSRHAHAPVHGNFSDLRIDAYQVEAGAPGAERTLVSSAEILATLARPSLGARVARDLVEVIDHRNAGQRQPDITVGLGLGPAALPVMRARFLGGATPAAQPGGLAAQLQSGTWSLELTALSGQIPDAVAQRELFLFSLDDAPLLRAVKARGLDKHDSITVGAVAGQGYLRVGTQQQAFPAAAEAGRRFLQQSFMGLVLGWQQQHPEAVAGVR